MEKIIELKNVSFKYPSADKCVLCDVSLDIKKGEMIAICGKSGSGKTTLLRQIKHTISPKGERTGEIIFNGCEVSQIGNRDLAAKIGFVMQDVNAQCVTDKVWHEMAFGLETLGYDNSLIRRRVWEISSFLGIEKWFYNDVSSLSGGQKQLLNLASVMILEPEVLILDEPTSQLSPVAAEQFLSVIAKINREMGITVIICEQRLQEILPMCDRMVVMEDGRVLDFGNVQEVSKRLKQNKNGMFYAMPVPLRVWAATENDIECPLTVGEGREWLWDFSKIQTLKDVPIREYNPSMDVAVAFKNVYFKYEKNGQDVIKGE